MTPKPVLFADENHGMQSNSSEKAMEVYSLSLVYFCHTTSDISCPVGGNPQHLSLYIQIKRSQNISVTSISSPDTFQLR